MDVEKRLADGVTEAARKSFAEGIMQFMQKFATLTMHSIKKPVYKVEVITSPDANENPAITGIASANASDSVAIIASIEGYARFTLFNVKIIPEANTSTLIQMMVKGDGLPSPESSG